MDAKFDGTKYYSLGTLDAERKEYKIQPVNFRLSLKLKEVEPIEKPNSTGETPKNDKYNLDKPPEKNEDEDW